MHAVHRRFALLGVVFAMACGQPFTAGGSGQGGGAQGGGGQAAASTSSGTGGDGVSSSASAGGGFGGGGSATAVATTDTSVTATATTSGTGGAGAGGGDTGGAGPGPCQSDSDCPGSQTVCQSPQCLGGACWLIVVDGFPEQTGGDCKRVVCENGSEVTKADPDDFAEDGLACTTDSCDGTTLQHTPKAPGTLCPGGVCGAGGNCVQCILDFDCGITGPCGAPKCVNGTCVPNAQPSGSFCGEGADQCDGQGHCVDCVNSGGCGECCVCNAQHVCVPA